MMTLYSNTVLHVRVCASLRVHVRARIYKYCIIYAGAVCAYVCVYVFAYVCAYMYVEPTYVHANIYAYVLAGACAYATAGCACVCA